MSALSVPLLDHLHRTRYPSRRGERGQALILLLLLLGLGAGMFVFSMAGNMSRTAERANTDARALAQAKAALIGYVVMVRTTRPGAFPCPDVDNDGDAEIAPGTDCPGYVANSNVYLGRLPWKTLGLPDLRDSSGERLWYAVSRDFARNPNCLPNCPDLTSNTQGQLTVTGMAPVSIAVAIVFAPGIALGSQVRDAANVNTAANYLEAENADGNNATFATAAASNTFNDRLLAITNADFMPEIEKYVAREMLALLTQYINAPGINYYPWASTGLNGDSNVGYNRGRFPCGVAEPTAWGIGGTPVLPLWLTNGCATVTGWASVIYYAVARDRLGPGTCITCSPGHMKLDGNNIHLLLITPGAFTGSPGRNWPNDGTTITGYFEDSANAANNSDVFVTPSASLYPHPINHDRVHWIP